ncbi:unnamed protein product [Cylicocyclus nassatus]|uniref:Uncharacterized protein n=1 Tax=Cylicocyclus nassatus TaxID=53992 RepID=A0AA36DJ06_CYLNA|nr:unnamed protein product [Cylicocyclus nassatus]
MVYLLVTGVYSSEVAEVTLELSQSWASPSSIMVAMFNYLIVVLMFIVGVEGRIFGGGPYYGGGGYGGGYGGGRIHPR